MGQMQSQLQNVQRGQLFFYFIYSVVIFAAVAIRMIKNKLDKLVDTQNEKASKYAQKKKPQKQQQNSVDQLDKSKQIQTKPQEQDNSQFDQTMPGKITKIIHDMILKFLPILFPFALNLVTGSSYGFLLFWFFVVQISYILTSILKIQQKCIQNKIIRAILENLTLILTFIFFLNMWATTSAEMPYFIKSN